MKDIPKWLEESLTQSPAFSNDAPLPDSYTDALDDTVPHLKIIDPEASDAYNSTGYDPYDTGVLKKN